VVYKGRRLRHKKITRLTKEQRQKALKEEALRQADISMLQLHNARKHLDQAQVTCYADVLCGAIG
jgi:hypothetical protein